MGEISDKLVFRELTLAQYEMRVVCSTLNVPLVNKKPTQSIRPP